MYTSQNFWKQDIDFLMKLHWVTVLRGRDSEGMTAISKDGSHMTHKKVGLPGRIISTMPKAMAPDVNKAAYMIHCRSATMGDVTIQNAHPFETDRYVSMHNGTMGGWEFWDQDKTDSEMVFEAMQSEGINPFLSRLRGSRDNHAYAFVIFDKQENRLLFHRNYQRPLYFATIQGWSGVRMWASEKEAFQFLVNRSEYNWILSVEEVKPYELYSLDIASGKLTNETIRPIYSESPRRQTRRSTPIIKPEDNKTEHFSQDQLEAGREGVWGTCWHCQNLVFGKEYIAAKKMFVNGKEKVICVNCDRITT